MSSESSSEEVVVDTVFEIQSIESSEELPKEEWMSLILHPVRLNPKKQAYTEGLYEIGSGEICTKYIPLSDSSVFRHPYYCYPAVVDPGIKEALIDPEQIKKYPDDGQELYLDLCKEMNQCPVHIFHKGLAGNKVSLSYYCVDPKGVRAMAEALKYNKTVEIFDMTDNFLIPDASYHLGEMLKANSKLKELNLSGCRLGPEGVQRLCAGLLVNRTLKSLNLNRNELTDDGGEYLAETLSQGIDLEQLFLSYNNLGNRFAIALANAIEFYSKLTHIDLSWNKLFTPAGLSSLLNRLQQNDNLQELNLAWNSLGPKVASAIKNIMLAPNLHLLDLSNNKLQGEAIDSIVENMGMAKKLQTLNLSYNPLNPDDAFKVINKMRMHAVKVQNLFMENIDVNSEFVNIIDRMKKMKLKKNVVVTFGMIIDKNKAFLSDPRETILSRVDFLGQKPKKNKFDIATIVLQLERKFEIMDLKEFSFALKEAGASMLDDDLIGEIVTVFPGPKSKKFKKVNIRELADYVKRKWPGRKLPKTPPPELEVRPIRPTEPQTRFKGKK